MYLVGEYRIKDDRNPRRLYSNVYKAMTEQNLRWCYLWKNGDLVADLEIIFDILHVKNIETGIEKAYDPHTGGIYPFEDREGWKKLLSS